MQRLCPDQDLHQSTLLLPVGESIAALNTTNH